MLASDIQLMLPMENTETTSTTDLPTLSAITDEFFLSLLPPMQKVGRFLSPSAAHLTLLSTFLSSLVTEHHSGSLLHSYLSRGAVGAVGPGHVLGPASPLGTFGTGAPQPPTQGLTESQGRTGTRLALPLAKCYIATTRVRRNYTFHYQLLNMFSEFGLFEDKCMKR